MSNQDAGAASPNPVPTSSAPAPPPKRSSSRRTGLLVFVLLLSLGGLWYDYKVARPSVEEAHKLVDKKNNDMNLASGRKYMTNKDVQELLHRTPVRSFQEGGYQVEEFAWTSGFPFRSHKYYAVYLPGEPAVFLRHYTFAIPPGELELSMPPAVEVSSTKAFEEQDAKGGLGSAGLPVEPQQTPPPAAEIIADQPIGGGEKPAPAATEEAPTSVLSKPAAAPADGGEAAAKKE